MVDFLPAVIMIVHRPDSGVSTVMVWGITLLHVQTDERVPLEVPHHLEIGRPLFVPIATDQDTWRVTVIDVRMIMIDVRMIIITIQSLK